LSGTQKRHGLHSWQALLLLIMLPLCMQGCFTSASKPFATGPGGQSVSVQQNAFKGKFYLSIQGNLYILNGTAHTTQELVHTGNVMDPAISPDGKWIAFIEKYQNYSNLCVVSALGGPVHVLRNGNGSFYNASGPIHNTYVWYAQPSWSSDGSHLLFLSDLEKDDWYQQTGQDAPLLDLQIFSIPFAEPATTPTDVAYATYGDGGDQNPTYRPGHANQIIYTHYSYDAATQTQQVIQLYMEDPNAISTHPGLYYPGSPGGGYDPAIAITPTNATVTDPAFSPNGNSIAYIKTDASGNQMELDVMSTPPATITQTPNDPATEQSALRAYASTSSHLLSNTYLTEPTWSPDGSSIAYYAYADNTFNLSIIHVSRNNKTGKYSLQGNPIAITSGGIDAASHPVWTT
jgi:Tol biopolymer transport system component